MRSGFCFSIIVSIIFCAPALAYDWSTNPGDGSPENPYQISTLLDILGVNDNLSANYIMVNDINLNFQTFSSAVIAPYYSSSGFQGNFNGANHKIIGLNIDTLADSDTTNDNSSYLGFFGYIGLGTVRNIILESVNIRSGDSSEYLAGLCGSNEGKIINCSVTGSIAGASYLGGLCGENTWSEENRIYRCLADVTLTGLDFPGYSYYLGGLCGINSGTIEASGSKGYITSGYQSMYFGGLCSINIGTITLCYSQCNIEQYNNSSYFGGLCGVNYAEINNCYSTGNLIGFIYDSGGFCGENAGYINCCYSIGNISPYCTDSGGFVGVSTFADGIQSCFWDTQTSGTALGVGSGSSSGVYGRNTDQMQQQSTFTDYGWDFVGESANGENEIWRMCVDGVDYPRLSWEFAQNGDFGCDDGVDFNDLQVLCEEWLTAADITPTTFNNACDANGDERIDLTDYSVLGSNW